MNTSDPEARSIQRLILILSVSGFASTFAWRAVEPLIVVIARDLRTDPHTIALISTAFALPYAFIQPVLGPVGDALGKERIMPVCLGILAATLLACALTPNVSVLFGLRVLGGMAAGGIIPMSLALIGDRVVMAGRQVAIGRFFAAVILGQLAGSSLSGLLAQWIGWRGVFALTAGLTASAAVAAIFGFEKRPRAEAGFSLDAALHRYRRVLANPRARFLFAFVFVDGLAFFSLFPYLAPMLEERGDGGSFEAGLMLAGFGIGGLAYSLLVAWLLRVLGLGRMLAFSGIIAGTGLVVIAVGPGWQLGAVMMGALGLGFYMLHNSYQTQVTEVEPDARASAVALHSFSFFVGQALGVVVFGVGLGGLGWTATVILTAATTAVLGLASAYVLVWRPQPRAR